MSRMSSMIWGHVHKYDIYIIIYIIIYIQYIYIITYVYIYIYITHTCYIDIMDIIHTFHREQMLRRSRLMMAQAKAGDDDPKVTMMWMFIDNVGIAMSFAPP